MAHSSADSSLAKAFTIALNCQPVAGRKVAGFWTPHEPIHSGDGLQIHFVPSWSVTALPDRPSMGCLSYGPYVMAALMDNRNLLVTQPNGILVRAGTKEPWLAGGLDVNALAYPHWLAGQSRYSMGVVQVGQLQFRPYYEVYQERYALYLPIKDGQRDSQSQRQSIGITTFDGNNTEYAHHLKTDGS